MEREIRCCPVCGTQWTPPSSSRKNRIFCSRICSNKSRTKPVLSRIENLTKMTDGPDSCYLWKGYFSGSGYAQLYANGKKQGVSRLLWELKRGPIPPGQVVRHSCDNPRCVRLEHLSLGSQKDNMQDAVQRRRIASGSRSGTHKKSLSNADGRAKINEELVRKIRKRLENGATPAQLATEYDVPAWTIANIRYRRSWRHVGG